MYQSRIKKKNSCRKRKWDDNDWKKLALCLTPNRRVVFFFCKLDYVMILRTKSLKNWSHVPNDRNIYSYRHAHRLNWSPPPEVAAAVCLAHPPVVVVVAAAAASTTTTFPRHPTTTTTLRSDCIGLSFVYLSASFFPSFLSFFFFFASFSVEKQWGALRGRWRPEMSESVHNRKRFSILPKRSNNLTRSR